MNIECHTEAGQARTEQTPATVYPYKGTGAMLMINGKWVTTKYAEQIQEAVMKPRHIAFFLKKYKARTREDYGRIYWTGIGWSRKRLSLEQDT